MYSASDIKGALSTISRRWHAVVTRQEWEAAPSLFLLTTGRTGTDTLRHLLSLSERIDAYHEPKPNLLKERNRARMDAFSDIDRYVDMVSRARGKALLNSYRRDRIYVETSARLTFFAPAIAQLLPNAQFLFLHRHPGDVVRSGMRRSWYAGHKRDAFRLRPGPGEPFFDEWKGWGAFEKNCWYWAATNDFALRVCKYLPNSRVQDLRSQHLFDGSRVKPLFDFIGVGTPAEGEIRKVLSKRYNAQRQSSFPRYSDWSRAQKDTLARIAGATMNDLEYASSH